MTPRSRTARLTTVHALSALAAVGVMLPALPAGPRATATASASWVVVSISSAATTGPWDVAMPISVTVSASPTKLASSKRVAIVQLSRVDGVWSDALVAKVSSPAQTLLFTPRHAGPQRVRVYLPPTRTLPAATSNELSWNIRPAPADPTPVGTVSVDAASVMGVNAARNGTPVPRTFGSVRLWDAGVTWREVEYQPGRFWWGRFDAAVAAAESQGQSILYTLGSTPEFYADPIDYPSRELYGPGSTQPPTDMARFREFATQVVTRYAGRIDAYQAGNEVDLLNYWQGTAAQAAEMTAILREVVAAHDPEARVVGSSFTTRRMASTYPFTWAYLTELGRRGWPIHAFTAHYYPLYAGDARDVGRLMGMVQRILVDVGAPALPVWNTEVNARANPTSTDPQLPALTDAEVRAFVAQSYLRGLSAGVTRTYWYAWLQQVPLLGITMYDGTVAAAAAAHLRAWLDEVLDLSGCSTSSAGLTQCRVTRTDGSSASLVWAETTGSTASVDELGGVRELRMLDGSSLSPVPIGTRVGNEPVLALGG